MCAIPEQAQPFDRLVAEHEANLPIGNLPAPASHGSRRNPLRHEAPRDTEAVKTQRGDVQQQ